MKITCFGVVSIHSYLIQQRPLEEVNYIQASENLAGLVILTLLLWECNCKSERRRFYRTGSVGKNFAHGEVLKVYVCNKSFSYSRQ